MIALLRRLPGMPMFAQITALLMLCVVMVQAISVLALTITPKPMPDFTPMSDIVRLYRGPADAVGRNGLRFVRSDGPPEDAHVDPWEASLRRELADQLGLPLARVRVVLWPGSNPPPLPIVAVLTAPLGPAVPPKLAARPDSSGLLIAPFAVSVQDTDGRWRTARRDGATLFDAWRWWLLLWLAVSAGVTMALSWFFARRAAAPLEAFARAVRRFGRDTQAPPLDIQGPRELRVAVDAFNEMQEQLRRHVESRTRMVAAIAHDLRTPLTRLAFRLASAPEPVRSKTADDIAEMEEMIQGVVAFVRDGRSAPRVRLELASLVETSVDELAETGAPLSFERGDPLVIEGDPLALRAAVCNLLTNAVKYGERATARVRAEGELALVEVDDFGPGIPESEQERVFEPFYRLERSRSRSTGGSGLGLALVRATAEAHGGTVTLVNRREGGLRATLSLPIGPAPGRPG